MDEIVDEKPSKVSNNSLSLIEQWTWIDRDVWKFYPYHIAILFVCLQNYTWNFFSNSFLKLLRSKMAFDIGPYTISQDFICI